MIHTRSKVNSMLQVFSVTSHQPMRSRLRSFTQTCVKSEIGPITVTAWKLYDPDGLLGSKGWKGIQNVLRHRPSNAAAVRTANSKEDRAAFEYDPMDWWDW